MGIISGAIGRGLSGLGGAMQKSGAVIEQSALDELRQRALLEVQQTFASAEADKTRQHQSAEAGLTRDLTREEGGATRGLTRDLHGQTDTRIREEGGATRDLQRDLAGQADTRIRDEGAANRSHAETLARISRQHATALANVGANLLTDPKSGKIAVVGRDGKFRNWLADNEGNPITGTKDLPASTKVYADILRDRLKALDREELDPLVSGNDKSKEALAARRFAINADLLNVLTGGTPGGVGGGTPGATSQPSPAAIAALKANPGRAEEFKAKYPGFDPAQYLGERPPIETFFGGSASRPSAGASSGSGQPAPQYIALPELVIPQSGQSPRERHTSAMEGVTQRNQAAYADRVGAGFRVMLQARRYSPEDQPVIEEALKVGVLTPQESTIAQQMLKAIQAQPDATPQRPGSINRAISGGR